MIISMKTVKGLKPLTILVNRSSLDVWQGFETVSGLFIFASLDVFFQKDANRTAFTKQNIVRNLVIELLQLTSSDILKLLGNRQKE